MHFKEFCLQLHRFVEHGDWDLHPHLTSFRSAGGAITVPSGVTTGSKNSWPSGEYHPYCSGLISGGSASRELFMIAAA